MDSEKHDKILDAALEVFLRYGFKKATMGDIATGAGMSRPSVYLVFSNKEDIFRAVIIRKIEEFSRESKRKLEECPGLEEGMTTILETWILEPFEMISTSPRSEELLEFGYTFAPDLRKQMLERIEEQLLEVIRSGSEIDPSDVADSGLTIETVARLMAVSTAEMKHSVRDPGELRQLLSATVRVHAYFLTGRSNPPG